MRLCPEKLAVKLPISVPVIPVTKQVTVHVLVALLSGVMFTAAVSVVVTRAIKVGSMLPEI